MRWLVAIVSLVPAIARAQPGAMEPIPVADPDTYTLAASAHAAGLRGDCVTARTLAQRIATTDPVYYRAALATDPVVVTCRPTAQTPSPRLAVTSAPRGQPPLEGAPIAGEFLLGGLFTIGGGILGALIGASGHDDDSAIGGAFLGVVIATPIPVVFIGNTNEVEGSTIGAIGGSILGSVVGTAMIVDANSEAQFWVAVAMPAAFATVGFNLSRSWKAGYAKVSLAPLPMKTDHGLGFSIAHGTW